MSKTERSQYATEDKKLEKKIRKNQTKKRSGTKNQEVQKYLEQEFNDLYNDEDEALLKHVFNDVE